MWGSCEDSLMNLDVNVCKNQRRVCFICGEELKCVGKTILLNKKFSFCLYINDFNPDFQNFDFFLPSYNPFKNIFSKDYNIHLVLKAKYFELPSMTTDKDKLPMTMMFTL